LRVGFVVEDDVPPFVAGVIALIALPCWLLSQTPCERDGNSGAGRSEKPTTANTGVHAFL
ncbi:MAG: hypothetical protein ACI8XM_002393, partial [Haloarculaceae archaeon]